MASNPRGRAPKLLSVRQRIDRLDGQLLRLLNERATLALLIGRIKKWRKWPVFDARREASVLRHVTRASRGPLSTNAIRKIFQTILTQCRRRQRDGKRRAVRGS